MSPLLCGTSGGMGAAESGYLANAALGNGRPAPAGSQPGCFLEEKTPESCKKL